jgi:hypothetical protein
VFYVCKSAFKEEEEGGHFVSPGLGCELANSSRLVFVLHETSSKGDSNWRLGFQKDEEPHIYERRRFCKEGRLFRFGAKEEEVKYLVICCSFTFVGFVCISVLDKL